MPAARLTTSWPAETWGAISASTSPMSCGLTTSVTVSACASSESFPTTSTPYFSRSSAARSGRFSPTTRSAGANPPRIRPESRVSPITPAPMMATVMVASSSAERRRDLVDRAGSRSLLRDQRPQEECQVRGTLGEPSHQVAVPLVAVGHVDAHLLAELRQPGLLLAADAVEHLELVGARHPAVPSGQGRGDLDQPRVVGGHHRVALAGHQ